MKENMQSMITVAETVASLKLLRDRSIEYTGDLDEMRPVCRLTRVKVNQRVTDTSQNLFGTRKNAPTAPDKNECRIVATLASAVSNKAQNKSSTQAFDLSCY